MEQIVFRAMGSRIEAFVAADGEAARRALRRLPRQFAVSEQILSRFRADSALNRLNAAAGNGPQRVQRELFTVIAQALHAARISGGLVVPTVARALAAIGYDRPFVPGAPPTASDAGNLPAPLAQLAAVQLDTRRRRVTLGAGVRLDLGGVGKGWAAQQALHGLRRHGPALVNAGGDVAVSGPLAGGRPWCLGIGDPFGRQPYLATLLLRRGGLATSGIDYRRWEAQGRTLHHIIDPRSGQPADTDLLSVSVVAAALGRAETIARSLLIGGSVRLAAQLSPLSPPVLAVTRDGALLVSPAMKLRLVELHHPR